MTLSAGSIFLVGIPQLVCPFGYPKFVETVGVTLAFLIGGLVFSFIASYLHDQYKNKGQLMLKAGHVTASITFWAVYFYIFYAPQNNYIFLFIFFLMGHAFMLVPLSIEISAECAYPLGYGVVHGIIALLCNFFQVIMGLVFFRTGKNIYDEEILENNTCQIADNPDGTQNYPKDYSFGFLCIAGFYTIYGLLPLFFLRVRYNRRDIDRQSGKLEQSGSENLKFSEL